MDLKDTIELMQSSDYKERFRAEYMQTKIRHDKLDAMLVRMEADKLDFTPRCTYALLNQQKMCMAMYLHTLQVRAAVEEIDLNM